MPRRSLPKFMPWQDLPEHDPRAPSEGHDDLRDGFLSYGELQVPVGSGPDESDLPEYGNRGYVETPTRVQLRPEDYERD